MTQTIWKYDLNIDDSQMIEMPIGAIIISCHLQYGRPVLWAIVDPRQPRKHRIINMSGTGRDLSNRILGVFIGTFLINRDDLVFHVFDGGER